MDAAWRMARSLERIEELLKQQVALLSRLVALSDEDDGQRCPKCGSVNLANESTMGHPRLRCEDCQETMEAAHG